MSAGSVSNRNILILVACGGAFAISLCVIIGVLAVRGGRGTQQASKTVPADDRWRETKAGNRTLGELVKDFSSEHPTNRMAAAQELAEAGRTSTPALTYLLGTVRDRAAMDELLETLQKMGLKAEGALPALKKAAKDGRISQGDFERTRDKISPLPKGG